MRMGAEELRGYTLHGTDDALGKVHDFYFDERTWKVQFVVVDTRKWLVGRFVLIAPAALGTLDAPRQILSTSLTKARVQHSPSIEEHRPVSRQHARDVSKYWDWPYFLPGDPRFDLGAFEGEAGEASGADQPGHEAGSGDDPHLRSARNTEGYHVHAQDGEQGHVEDWLVDVDSWTLREAVIDTRNWLPGQKLRLPCEHVTEIRAKDEAVCVDLTLEQLSALPRYTGGS